MMRVSKGIGNDILKTESIWITRDIRNSIFWSIFLITARLAQINESAYYVQAAILVVFVIIVWQWPVGAIAAILCLSFLGDSEILFGITLNLLGRILLSVRLILNVFSGRLDPGWLKRGTGRFVVPFFAVAGVSFLIYGSTVGSAFILKFMLTSLVVFSVVAHIKTSGELHQVQLVLILTASASGAWTIGEYLRNPYRSGGLMDNPNLTAMYLGSLFILCFCMVTNAKGWQRPIYLFLSILIATGCILTGSRAGILIISFGLIAYLFFTHYKFRSLMISLFLAALAMTFIFTKAPNSFAITREAEFFSNLISGDFTNPTTGSEIDRIILLRSSVQIWKSNPILGVGPNNWYQARIIFSPTARTTTPHIYIAQIMAELGTLGLATYGFFVSFSLVSAIRLSKQLTLDKQNYLAGWLASCVALMGAVFSGYAYNPYLYVFIVMATSSATILNTADT